MGLWKRKKEPILRIRTSYGADGRMIMSLAEDEESVRARTGSYTPDPDKMPPGAIVEGYLPGGRFYPTREFVREVQNYQLSALYEPGTGKNSGYTGHAVTPDEGQVTVTVAKMVPQKDGGVRLEKPEAAPKCLPGRCALYVLEWQDAAAYLAGKSPSEMEVQGEALHRWQKRMDAIRRFPGGPDACRREADLRMVMHRQGITDRADGMRVLGELDEMLADRMEGKPDGAFARAVAGLGAPNPGNGLSR